MLRRKNNYKTNWAQFFNYQPYFGEVEGLDKENQKEAEDKQNKRKHKLY